MKNLLSLVITLCLLAGCSFLAYQYGYERGSARRDTDVIDRSPQVLYPEEQYRWGKSPVYIYWSTEDTHYHGHYACPFAIWVRDGFLKISEFEALERGYTPCVNCVFDQVDIR